MNDLSDDARRLLNEAGVAYEPTQARLRKVQSAVHARCDASPLSAEGGAGIVPAQLGKVTAITLSAAMAVVMATGVYWTRSADSVGRVDRPTTIAQTMHTAQAPVAPANALVSTPVSPPAPPSATTLAPNTVAHATEALPAPQRGGQPARPARASQSRTRQSDRSTVRSSAAVAARSGVDLDGASPEKELKPVTREPKPAAARAVAAPETPDPVAVDTLTEELQLVRGARAQLVRGDAPAAFELLHRHTLRFPTGVLREERLALQVMTACKLGRAPDAREAMATLQRIAPRSPHLSRSSAACVNPNP